jgi:hypothetical protein
MKVISNYDYVVLIIREKYLESSYKNPFISFYSFGYQTKHLPLATYWVQKRLLSILKNEWRETLSFVKDQAYIFKEATFK